MAVDELPRPVGAGLNFTRGSAQTQCRGRRPSALFGWPDTLPKVGCGSSRRTLAGQCRTREWQNHRGHPPDCVLIAEGVAPWHSRVDLYQQSCPRNARSGGALLEHAGLTADGVLLALFTVSGPV